MTKTTPEQNKALVLEARRRGQPSGGLIEDRPFGKVVLAG
jgi:hypothetical protein